MKMAENKDKELAFPYEYIKNISYMWNNCHWKLTGDWKKRSLYNQDSKKDMKLFGSILGAPRSSGTTVLYVSAWKEFSEKQNYR